MPRTVHRLTKSQRTELRRWLRAHHRDWISNRVTQGQAADILTRHLGFIVTRGHVGAHSRALRLRWPFNPRPHRGSRTPEPRPASAEPVRVPGKRLTNEAIESLRYMADHLLAYAAEIEFIINNGRPSTN